MKKRDKNVTRMWAWRKMSHWLKYNCLDIETYRFGDMKYCLEKYFEVLGKKKPNKKSGLIMIQEYNDPKSPIYRGVTMKGVVLKRKTKKERKSDYERYLQSAKWRTFKRKIISERGQVCESCSAKVEQLDLHHKTYARLFDELPQDVILLCRSCHNKIHDK